MKLPPKIIFWFLVFLLLGFFLLFLEQLGWLGWFHRLSQPTVASIHFSAADLKQRINPFVWFGSLCPNQTGRLEELEKEVARLSGLQTELISCQEELKASRRLLGAPLPSNWQFLPGKIFKTNGFYYLDQGQESGVKQGQALVWENIYLGKVAEVREEVARLELVKDDGSKTPVKVKSGKGILAKGILYGQGGLELEVGQILTQESVSQGDLVVTAGEGEIPPDLAIGRVKGAKEDKSEIFQKALVVLLVDPEQLEIVFLITKR
jgi:cell shape-determining protein MreC